MVKMDIDDFLKKRSETFNKGAELVKESTIGKHVAALISETGNLTLDNLLQSLQKSIDNSESAMGRTAVDQDIRRMADQKALNHVRSLLASRPAD